MLMGKRIRRTLLVYLIINWLVTGYFAIQQFIPLTPRALKSEPESPYLRDIYQSRIEEALKLFRDSPKVTMPKIIVMFGMDEPNASYSRTRHIITVSEGIARDYPLNELAAILAHEIAHARESARRGGSTDTRSHWQVDVEAAKFVGKESLINVLERLKFHEKNFCTKRVIVCIAAPLIPLEKRTLGSYLINERISKVASTAF